jgi:CRP-like cAMP-binding protein
VVRLRKGATLFDVGSHAPHFYVVRRGTVIISAPDAQGREWIVNFCEPGDAVASMSSLAPPGLRRLVAMHEIPKIPALRELGVSQTKASALRHTELDRVDGRHLEWLCGRYVEWSNAVLSALFAHNLAKEKRERELLTMTPEERYRQFVRDYPHLLDDLAQKDVARHLGITPVGLSRIASRVRAGQPPEQDLTGEVLLD